MHTILRAHDTFCVGRRVTANAASRFDKWQDITASALPLKADIRSGRDYVGYGP
jgi:hypothetical protein